MPTVEVIKNGGSYLWVLLLYVFSEVVANLLCFYSATRVGELRPNIFVIVMIINEHRHEK